MLEFKYTESIFQKFKNAAIQLQPFDEVNACFYRPNESISTEDEVRGRYSFIGSKQTLLKDIKKGL